MIINLLLLIEILHPFQPSLHTAAVDESAKVGESINANKKVIDQTEEIAEWKQRGLRRRGYRESKG